MKNIKTKDNCQLHKDLVSLYRNRHNTFDLEIKLRQINKDYGHCDIYINDGALYAVVEDGQTLLITTRSNCIGNIDSFVDDNNILNE